MSHAEPLSSEAGSDNNARTTDPPAAAPVPAAPAPIRRRLFAARRRGGFGAKTADSSRRNLADRSMSVSSDDSSSVRRSLGGRTLELHEACMSCPSLSELRQIFDTVQKEQAKGFNSNICSYPDPDTGRMPLHCIGLNHSLVLMSTGGPEQSSAMVENFVFRELIPAYPVAIVDEDANGRIPFTEVIINWVKARRAARRKASCDSQKKEISSSDARSEQRIFAHSTFGSIETQHDASDEEDENFHGIDSWYEAERDKDGIPPMVEWSLIMLSYIVKKPSRLGLGASVDQGTANEDGREGADELDRSFLEIGAALTAFHGDVVVQKVSAIPHLVEELLRTTDKDARDRIFNLSVIRRSLLRNASFGDGQWFIRMLATVSGKDQLDCNEGAVYYLEQVSSLLPEDSAQERRRRRGSFITSSTIPGKSHVGLVNQISSDDVVAFQNKRDSLFHAIGNLDGFLPCLVMLHEKLVDRAAVTSVVQFLLNNNISSPFATVIAFFDVFYSILLIASFRAYVAEPMFHLMLNNRTFSPRRHLYLSMVFSTCILSFCFQIHNQNRGKWHMSPRIFWSDLHNFWNLAESAPVLMALVVSVLVNRIHFHSQQEGGVVPHWLQIAVAVTTGALWLKLLAHLKMINKQLATFVLCIIEIMRDIKWFLLVQLIAMAAFAQMHKTIMFEPEVAKGQCHMQGGTSDGTPSSHQVNHDFVIPSADAATSRCVDVQDTGTAATVLDSSASPYYYFQAYIVMLGAFETSNLHTMFSVLLFTVYTFLVTIVLLNVLIAIVSDSYARSMDRSRGLFGRARMMFGADLELQRKYWQLQEENIRKNTLSMLFFRRGLFALTVFFTVSISESTLMGGIGRVESLLIPLGTHFNWCILTGILRGTSSHDGSHFFRYTLSIFKLSAEAKTLDKLVDEVARVIQVIMIRFLDISDDLEVHGAAAGPSGNQGRRVEDVQRLTEVIHSELKDEVKKSERNLKATLSNSDNVLRGEMAHTENRLVSAMESSEDRIRFLIKESEERMLEAMKSAEERQLSFLGMKLPTMQRPLPRNGK